MTGGKKDGSGTSRDAELSREERRAQALRANLQRRKAQARARKSESKPPNNNESEGS
ncbi:hypothetical protein AXZ77_0602 [Thioclava sp. ES.031]|uniref:DUF4169 domain-containing protein n=1 Tax=Thioclava electrotropha TaxID=1549850 RepID=A0ABX6YQL5_9RHOB|nr:MULTISPECIES: hypothetical protein [Thioclava]PFG62037.1 hypothetical protein AXZ77_0602 [Thioclava sp. ES.031]QPZ89973.1 hypothetical protein AKL02_003075 [Thioclava electrotropha]|tara:strand:+ start:525 stop:695 length:171 start_codon:yes stop_codon:yes gene_type:complete